MLTLFATPKPFNGHNAIIQRNAIRSWTLLPLDCEVILFGDAAGTAEVAAEFGVRHVAHVTTNEFGTPLVNALFADAQRLAAYDLLCYINADIILLGDFATAIHQVHSFERDCLLVGQRWNLGITTAIDFEPAWEQSIRARLAQDGQLHSARGIDYFVFSRSLWKSIPAFAIGRTAWDNWLLFGALDAGAALIDATQTITAIHQNHDYSHTSDNARTGTEAQRNLQLASADFYRSLQYGIHDATHVSTRSGIQPNVSRALSGAARFIRRLRLSLRGAVLSFKAAIDRTPRQRLANQPEVLGENLR